MPKRTITPLVNGRVRLRLLEERDLPATLAWRNQDHIRKWFFFSDVITPEQHRRWFDAYLGRDDDFVFVIEETEELRRSVGQVALYKIDWAAGTAEFGRLMIGDAEAQGRGLARLATACLVDEALGAWGLRSVHLEVRTGNEPALAVYRSTGFAVVSTDADVVRMQKDAGDSAERPSTLS
jgi:UDP-4-amino-4,6-dideoxy-N-acetyl-beta-L-altrosamine N-acetyltransferase